MKKRLLSLFMAACLLLGCAPALAVPAAAAEPEPAGLAYTLPYGDTISAGSSHIAVIKEDGTLWGWGNNVSNELGVGAMEDPVSFPIQVPVDNAVSVRADDFSTAVLKSNGELWNWGSHDANGKLGREAEGDDIGPGRVMDNVVQLSTGASHSTAVTRDGTMWVWGANGEGQLGNGGRDTGYSFDSLGGTYSYQPLPVRVLENVRMSAAGGGQTFAVLNDGSLWAWGSNDYGQLGNDTSRWVHPEEEHDDSLLGVKITRTSEIKEEMDIVDADGCVWHVYPGVKESTHICQLSPIKVMEDVEKVATDNHYAIVLKKDGSVWTLGDGGLFGGRELSDEEYRSIGREPNSFGSYYPIIYTYAPKHVMDGAVDVATGGGSFAAIKEDGSLWTWGFDYSGQLGREDKDYDSRKTPGKVMDDVAAVTVGSEFMAALKTDGSLWTWGSNYLGQLGVGFEDDRLTEDKFGTHADTPIKVMDGVALPSSSLKQEIKPVVLPSSALIETAPIQPEGAPVWDTTAWGNRYMNIPDGTAYFNGNAYAFYISQDCTWDEAENYCLSVGGHLATVTSREEQEFIQGGIGGPSWLGGRRNPYGGWDWVTGESWGYQCWYPGQNDNYGGYEDALYAGGYWGDVSNNATGIYGFVCEWETAGRALPTPPAPIYSVTFEVQNEARIDSIRKQVIQGQTYGYLPTPTMEGWNFVGWYDGPEYSRLITSSTVVNLEQSVHLYAKWTPNSGGPSVPRLSYSFGNNWRDLNYPEKGYRIPLDRYQYIFGNSEFANRCYAEEKEWGGSCGGFCGTSTMLYMQNTGINPSQFRSGAALAGELKIGDGNNALGMTLREWIETVQVSQSSAIIQSQAARSAFDYNGLVQGVLNFRSNNTEPIIIWIWGPYGKGGHAVVGVGAWRKDEGTDCITVYDPNWPNTDRYIDLYRDSQGRYCGWYYDLGDAQWGSAYGNGVIQYVRYSDYMNAWNSRGTQTAISGSLTVNSANASVYDYSGNLVAAIRDGQVESLRSDVFPATDGPAGEGSGKDGVTLWVPCEYFSVVNEDDNTDHLEVRVDGADSSVSASTSSDRVLVYGGGEDSMVLVSGKDERYEMVLTSTDGGEVRLTGTTKEDTPTCFARLSGELSGMGVGGAELSVDGKEESVADRVAETTAVAIVTSTDPSAISSVFPDVPRDAGYATAVQWAYEAGIINGTGLGTFSPEFACTRADAVTLLWRALGCPAAAASVQPFADVNENRYYYQAVVWAAGSGVAQGTDETHFSPNQTCSNEEFFAFLWQALGRPEARMDFAGYDDAAAWAVGTGLLRDRGIQSPCRRCDAVEFLYRALA